MAPKLQLDMKLLLSFSLNHLCKFPGGFLKINLKKMSPGKFFLEKKRVKIEIISSDPLGPNGSKTSLGNEIAAVVLMEST
jgi:hypothetical protein